MNNDNNTNIGLSSAPQVEQPSVVVSAPMEEQKPKWWANRKTPAAIFSAVLMMVGVTAGVALVGREQYFGSKAWDCGKYNFSVGRDGSVIATNASTRNEPDQKADVYINNNKVATLDVPALTPGQNANIGNVTVPGGAFTWRVDGLKDCDDSGSYDAQMTATCSEVKAYNSNWQELSANDLKNLKPNDVVRFVVGGTTSGGSFQKAQFTINGTQRAEVTNKKPGEERFYDEYTVPSGVTSFNVQAKIFHSTLGWL
jgi:hypothetical protein